MSENTITCSSCSSTIPVGVEICPNCGAPLGNAQTAVSGLETKKLEDTYGTQKLENPYATTKLDMPAESEQAAREQILSEPPVAPPVESYATTPLDMPSEFEQAAKEQLPTELPPASAEIYAAPTPAAPEPVAPPPFNPAATSAPVSEAKPVPPPSREPAAAFTPSTSQPAQSSSNSKWIWIAVGCVVLMIMCCCLILGGFIILGNASQQFSMLTH